MEQPTVASSIRRFQKEKTNLYAAIALLVYTAVVYVWSLAIYPLGPDFAAMANPNHTMPAIPAAVFRAEIFVFRSWTLPYHLVNLVLLYVCALLVYRLGREVILGPAWLSLLAAVLYMASPVHRDAVFLLSGMDAGLPAAAILLALYLGVTAIRFPTWSRQSVATAAIVAVFFLFGSHRFLVVPVLFAAWLLPSGTDWPARRPIGMLAVCWFLLVAAITLSLRDVDPGSWSPVRMWAPLYFALYPLGFLPNTIRQFQASPWLAWGCAALLLLCVMFTLRKARSRALIWAVLAAVTLRLGQGGADFDLVHLLGGRNLLVANAFVWLAVCEVFYRVARHPKWHRPVVTGTTLWCLVLFGMQIYGALVWHAAGEKVRAFQESFEAAPAAGIVPDIRFYRGAPVFFRESVGNETRFSRRHDVQSLLQLNIRDDDGTTWTVTSLAPEEAVVEITSDDLGYALGWPYSVDARETDSTTVRVVDADQTGGRLVIRPKRGALPAPFLTVVE